VFLGGGDDAISPGFVPWPEESPGLRTVVQTVLGDEIDSEDTVLVEIVD
jgi:hypothetical protein